jgi:hypothetical protein
LKLVDHSYDVPTTTTTTTDTYTGKQIVTTHPGYHVDNRTIEVTIKNQQFTSYQIDSQHTIFLFYNVSSRGHYGGEWGYYPSGSYGRNSDAVTRIVQSTSDYTVVSFKAPNTEGQVDYRVQAQIGYYTEYQEFIAVPGAPFSHYIFTGEESGWSSTQTISIPGGSASSSPTQTVAPTSSPKNTVIPSAPQTATPTESANNLALPQLDLTLIGFTLLGGVIVVLIVFLVLLRKRIRVLELKQNGT